jgi:hypothetical protein
MRRTRFAAIALTALLVGCEGSSPRPVASPSPTPAPSPTTPAPASPTPSQTSYAATAKGSSVRVLARPNGPVTHTLANPQPSGAPLTFLLKGPLGGDWLEVYLPVRPNGSSGFVRARDVTIASVPYRVDVLRRAHRLRLFRDGALVKEFPVAIGTHETPTPGGVFYLKELLVPREPGGPYGPYAYGLSGFSNVLTRFGGGDGVIGIHGTNDERTVGTDVSHGCIRMRNADVTYLAHLLPLGTPVRILA